MKVALRKPCGCLFVSFGYISVEGWPGPCKQSQTCPATIKHDTPGIPFLWDIAIKWVLRLETVFLKHVVETMGVMAEHNGMGFSI